MQAPYHQTFKLLAPLTNIECWNATNGEYANFEAGEEIKLLNEYDATQTTIQCVKACTPVRLENGFMDNQPGRPLLNPNGTPALLDRKHGHDENGNCWPQMGYRFIVNNMILGEAIGVKMPERTADFVGTLMAYESGELTPEQEEEFLGELQESGVGNKLQGHYGRRM